MYLDEIDLFYVMALALLGLLSLLLLGPLELRKMGSRHQWPQLIGWNLVLFLFLTHLVFLGGETWYRFFSDRTDAVGVMKVAQRWKTRHYQFNAQGWRDNVDYALEPRTPKRITFLGDSFTAGAGIKNVEDRFSNILRTQLPDAEIHVLARNGFGTDSHLETVKYLNGLEYPTDVAVLAYVMNDISCCIPSIHTFNRKMRQYRKSLSYLQRESYFLNMLTYRWKTKTDPAYGNYLYQMRDAYSGSSWEHNAVLLRELRQRLEADGIPLLVVTFPFMQNLRPYGFDAAHKKLETFWKVEGVPHLDLLPLFSEHADKALVVNRWDAHPNEYANKLAAAAILDFLASEGILQRPF